MPSPLTADSFRSIRTWAGSKDRAFEELCYQLLREDDDLPPGKAIPVRTGNPDGGVEWYALTRENAQWGWQAKYIFDIDSLLSAMTVTVRRVVKERPELVRLTFCIPWNLPAGTSGRQRASARQKYENKVAAWKRDIKGYENIEFVLVQESDLLARLALPKHAGRRWFWWNEPYFGAFIAREEWLAKLLAAEGLALVWGAFGERRRLQGDRTYRHPWLEYYASASFDGKALRTAAPLIVEEPGHRD